MSNQNSQFGIKEVMNLTICEYALDPQLAKPFAVIDYAQVTGLEHASERLFLHGGRGNKKLLSFDHTKTATLKLTLPLVDFKLLSKISGDDIQNKIAKIFKAETKMVIGDSTGNYIKLEKEPIDNTLFVNILSGYRELEDNLTVIERGNKSPDENKCSIIFENGEIRLYLNSTTCPYGSEVRVHYTHQSVKETQKIIFSADKFPKFITLKGDTLFRNQVTTEDEIYNFLGYKGQFQTNFTLNMNSTNPTTLELTVDLYAHKDKETQEELYYEFIKEEMDDVLGEFSFTNVPSPINGINIKVGEGNYIIGVQQENVLVIPESDKESVFTVNDLTITPVGAGSGKVILKKHGYEDLEILVNVIGADTLSARSRTVKPES